MTGSALARYELRGTFRVVVLAALRPPRGRCSLDVLEVSWRALWAMICQDLDRHPRNTKTLKTPGRNKLFLRCRSSSGGILGTSWPRLGQSCRRSGGLLGTFRALLWGISAALEASRRAKMAQDALECILGVNLGSIWITPWGARSARASEARGAQACSAKQTA